MLVIIDLKDAPASVREWVISQLAAAPAAAPAQQFQQPTAAAAPAQQFQQFQQPPQWGVGAGPGLMAGAAVPGLNLPGAAPAAAAAPAAVAAAPGLNLPGAVPPAAAANAPPASMQQVVEAAGKLCQTNPQGREMLANALSQLGVVSQRITDVPPHLFGQLLAMLTV